MLYVGLLFLLLVLLYPHTSFLCKIINVTSKEWNVIFVYVASLPQHRQLIWNQLRTILSLLEGFVIVCEFNQLDKFEDKSGYSPFIKG